MANSDLFQNRHDSGKDGKMSSDELVKEARAFGMVKSARVNPASIKHASNSVGDFQDFEQHG